MVDSDPRRTAPNYERPVGSSLRRYRLIGCVALAVLAASILTEPPWTLSVKDAAYWLVVTSMIVARYREERVHADAAMRQSMRRGVAGYAIGLVVIAVFVWVIAQCQWVATQDPTRLV